MFAIMKEIANLQKNYRNLLDGQKLTKKAICDLVVPFRDKYHLKDSEALQIARDGMSSSNMVNLLETSLGATYSIRKWFVKRPNDNVIITIMKNKSDETYSFINLTANHICTCKFNSIDAALDDLEECRKRGEVIEYYEI